MSVRGRGRGLGTLRVAVMVETNWEENWVAFLRLEGSP